jgi:hypothetical protein
MRAWSDTCTYLEKKKKPWFPDFNSEPTNYEEDALLLRQQCRLLYTEWLRSHLGAQRQHVENQASGVFCSTLYNVCIVCRRSLVSSPTS